MKIIIGLSEEGKIAVREFFEAAHKLPWEYLNHEACYAEALAATSDRVEGVHCPGYELGGHETKSGNPATWEPKSHHFIYEEIDGGDHA